VPSSFYCFSVISRWPSTLPDGIDQFPYSCEMMVVVFGNKIEMACESHRRL
jgi:hypothetical protein